MTDLRMRAHSAALLSDLSDTLVYRAFLPQDLHVLFDPVRDTIVVDARTSWPACRVNIMHAVGHLIADETPPDPVDEYEAEVDAARRLIPLELLARHLASSWDPQRIAAAMGVDITLLVVRVLSLIDVERYALRRLVEAARNAWSPA